MKLYTKTGDDGTTQLMGGMRVLKNNTRVTAYGEVDELNAGRREMICSMPQPARAMGYARSSSASSKWRKQPSSGAVMSAVLVALI